MVTSGWAYTVAEAAVVGRTDPITGQAIDFADLRPFQGGLAAEPACAELVRRFEFGGLVPGF